MITTIKDWKNQSVNSINENIDPNNPSGCLPFGGINPEALKQAKEIAQYAKDFDMSKPDTIGMVQKIFVDPAQAPDDISVAFVQNYLGVIVSLLDCIPDSEYPENPLTFTQDMEENDLPFECVMYIENNDKITKLVEALNKNINKSNFKVIYENNIFFINSLDNINEKKNQVIMKVLQENNAKNVNEQLKWKRKLK